MGGSGLSVSGVVRVVELSVEKTVDLTPDVQRKLRELLKRQILVGVTEDTAKVGVREGEINNAAKAYINDNGAPEVGIPQREFMRPGVETVQGQISEILSDALEAKLAGDDVAVDTALNRAGSIGRDAIVAEIDNGPLNPGTRTLSPVTLRLRQTGRGGDRGPVSSVAPLVETGSMQQSITYVVE